MGVSAPASAKANGLTTVINVITSPREAFETLRVAPTWGWAFLIAVVLGAIGQYLATPATVHAIQVAFPQQIASSPQLAGMTPEQQQRALNLSLSLVRLAWLFTPLSALIAALASTIVMLIFKAIGRGDATFKQLWCAAMNVCVVAVGAYGLLNGLIALVRGASSYNSTIDAYSALPSLAWLAPHAGIKLVAFLSSFNIAGLWGAFLVTLAMMYVAKTSKANGILCALASLCVGGGFLAWAAR